MKLLHNLKHLRVLVFALLLFMTSDIIYSFFFVDMTSNLWFTLSVFELGTISILAVIVFKLVDVIEQLRSQVAANDD